MIMHSRITALVKTPSLLAAPAVAGVLLALAPALATAETGGAAALSSAPATQTDDSSASAPPTASKPAIASWFGPGFYGHKTACGQILRPALVGVANRRLPCGTLVAVSYRGQHLIVPVLDRGPYGHNGASWDLTSGAARALKIKETVRIATLVVGSTPNTPTLGLPPVSEALSEVLPAAAPTGGVTAS